MRLRVIQWPRCSGYPIQVSDKNDEWEKMSFWDAPDNQTHIANCRSEMDFVMFCKEIFVFYNGRNPGLRLLLDYWRVVPEPECLLTSSKWLPEHLKVSRSNEDWLLMFTDDSPELSWDVWRSAQSQLLSSVTLMPKIIQDGSAVPVYKHRRILEPPLPGEMRPPGHLQPPSPI